MYESLLPTQRRFLAAFEASGSITQAARWAKLCRNCHYQWMREVPAYPDAFKEAEKKASRSLEDEAVRRAHQGVSKTVRHKGKIVGYESEYSDSLLIFLLKGTNPEKFKERSSNEMSGPNGGPIKVTGDVSARQQVEAAIARVNARARPEGDTGQSDGSAA